jgi:hypothetical protein
MWKLLSTLGHGISKPVAMLHRQMREESMMILAPEQHAKGKKSGKATISHPD